MNTVQITGRLTTDPEIRYTQNQEPIARFTLAVDRPGKDAGADFVSCSAFGKTAKVIGDYCKKGRLIGAVGRIRTGNYQKQDGSKVYFTEVAVDRMEFLGGREEQAQPAQQTQLPPPTFRTPEAQAPTYRTPEQPTYRQEQIPADWIAEPLTPDADLPF